MSDARILAEEAARASYGRLLAWTAARTRDIAEAEDALADAFAAALETWPVRGAPRAPDAWLLKVARRKLIDRVRRAKTRRDAEPDLMLAAEEAEAAIENDQFPDERLKLLFICAHPAIEEGVRTPLMLQTVLGLDAERIASAFVVAPATMGQRLVRAKRKIKEARLRFEPPEAELLPERTAAVLDAIYAAFNAGWEHEGGADPAGLAAEAIFLGRLIAALLPQAPEARGLLALMLFAHSRRGARRVEGRYVALDEQDTAFWDTALITEAEQHLADAARLRQPGRFQIEAAIQSAHLDARLSGRDTRSAVVELYERLMVIAPSFGAGVGRAAALSKADRDAEALAALDALGTAVAARYQPYWAARAHVMARLGRPGEARDAYVRAIGLSADPAVRNFLTARLSELG